MLIVNADDFGRSRPETDAVIACFEAGRITSTTAMMFMEDSERAATMAIERGFDVGLHLNLSQRFAVPDAANLDEHARVAHDRVIRFLTASKYAVLFYQPFLRTAFRNAIDAQVDEFERLYRRQPTHIDGHQHQHLCANVLIDRMLPRGQRVRRSFSFWPGEKGGLNRAYRSLVDRTLERTHVVADYFFALDQCLHFNRMSRVFRLAETSVVELMTHPVRELEYRYLMSDDYLQAVQGLERRSYAALARC
jgi:predicted glycoside hydrolase/deacetylase ChbG (UPF0249 family)